ncbi:MAG TPA: Fe2+-dependent dioxygenase [Burkholderiales bacterium]
MLVQVPKVLNGDEAGRLRAALQAPDAPWVDGRVTAGYQGAPLKRNLQIEERSPLAAQLGDAILAALERNALFISAALPKRVYPPMFNRYAANMEFGSHVDNALRLVPGSGARIRTDLSATLFLSAPEDYDGGELVIEDTYGAHSVKLAAGDMILYPASSLHRVTPVRRGARLASFFWVESMIRDDGRRALLFDLDGAIQRLNASGADETARAHLVACYHNLLRMWADA